MKKLIKKLQTAVKKSPNLRVEVEGEDILLMVDDINQWSECLRYTPQEDAVYYNDSKYFQLLPETASKEESVGLIRGINEALGTTFKVKDLISPRFWTKMTGNIDAWKDPAYTTCP